MAAEEMIIFLLELLVCPASDEGILASLLLIWSL